MHVDAAVQDEVEAEVDGLQCIAQRHSQTVADGTLVAEVLFDEVVCKVDDLCRSHKDDIADDHSTECDGEHVSAAAATYVREREET